MHCLESTSTLVYKYLLQPSLLYRNLVPESLNKKVKLSRTTAKVYFFLVKKQEARGVREIARALGLPPSTVYYSLKKLEELGLVERARGGYRVKNIVKPDDIVIVKGLFIHRLTIYSFFFLGVAIGFITISALNGLNIDRALTIAISLTAFALFFTEGLKYTKKYSV